MKDTLPQERKPAGQDDQLADVMRREGSRLRNFIRRRVRDPGDVDDILQDVFSTLVEANRLLMPIDHVTGWLFRVARNRITDLFRARAPEALELDDLLPSPGAGPEAEYARVVLLETLEQAIAELPAEQRDVFIAHELEGRSFKQMSAATPLFGWPSITLLQGFGLLALCRILFGGFGSGGGGGGGYSKHMTPEERERFRQRMSERSCRSAGESAES